MERNVTLDFVRGVAILPAIKHQRLWATKGGLSQSRLVRCYYAAGCMDLGIS